MMHLLYISCFISYVYIPHAIRFDQSFVLLSLFSPFVFAFPYHPSFPVTTKSSFPLLAIFLLTVNCLVVGVFSVALQCSYLTL